MGSSVLCNNDQVRAMEMLGHWQLVACVTHVVFAVVDIEQLSRPLLARGTVHLNGIKMRIFTTTPCLGARQAYHMRC